VVRLLAWRKKEPEGDNDLRRLRRGWGYLDDSQVSDSHSPGKEGGSTTIGPATVGVYRRRRPRSWKLKPKAKLQEAMKNEMKKKANGKKMWKARSVE